MSPASSGGSRIAFFGGSFDPPHLGHIAVAHAAQQALHLDQVLFAPVGLQPLKPTGSSASFEDRVAMTRLAIAKQPGFAISLLDAPSPVNLNPNYTVDTLTRLRQSLPATTQLFLLLGADSFRSLPNWHRAAELVFLTNLIVASRPDPSSAPDIEDLTDISACLPAGIALNPIPGQPNQYRLTNSKGEQSQLTILPDLRYDISATQLRNQVQGHPGKEPPLLNPAVLQYIHEQQLYT
jgi:nicotinate-nucleotide adenylyltransferase